MKTPDEIKKGLECCSMPGCKGEDCPYNHDEPCYFVMHADVLVYIQQLERERDAAVNDIGRCCATCIHYNPKSGECTTNGCFQISGRNSKWEWRGVQEVE